MPKKSARRKVSSRSKRVHYLWSIFFLAFSMAINIYFIAVGMSTLLTLSAVCVAALALIAVGYERRTGKLGKGKFLWSIFFAALTVGLTLSIAAGANFALWTVISVAASAIGLGLLCWEKYNY